jgi:hypothetical protein
MGREGGRGIGAQEEMEKRWRRDGEDGARWSSSYVDAMEIAVPELCGHRNFSVIP